MSLNLTRTGGLLLLVSFLAILVSVTFLTMGDDDPEEETLTIAAATNLVPVLESIADRFEADTSYQVDISFGSSGQLAQQIESGAPIDLYISADRRFVEDLVEGGLILEDSRAIYARGRLVLWSLNKEVESIDELQDSGISRVAIANPDHAPYGRAAKQALESAGLWNEIQPKLVLGQNIRSTMQYAESGDVEVALVAQSLAESTSEGSWSFVPAELHQPIDQALGVVAATKHEAGAREFAEFMLGDEGQTLLEEAGFERGESL